MTDRPRVTYLEKLKDPRWQRKRLETLNQDGWACQSCKATEKTLHVHHMQYEAGREPWEYDGAYLVTLCVDCHEIEGEHRRVVEQNILEQLRAKWLFSEDLIAVAHLLAVLSKKDLLALARSAVQKDPPA